MCTSLTYQTQDGDLFLARTMDYGEVLDGRPVFLPRQFEVDTIFCGQQASKYAILGAGSTEQGQVLIADGFNEHGLAVAELYFANEIVLEEKPLPNKINLAPHELITYLLGNFKTLAEIDQAIAGIALVVPNNGLPALPLHFILSDKTGQAAVIEARGGELCLIDNPVGVMTNTPNLDWHIRNLNNYLHIQPQAFSNKQFGNVTASPFSQGTGSQGLPGSYTPPDRFVRAAFGRQYLPTPTTLNEAVTTIFHILDMVAVPKGVNLTAEGVSDYTQYTGIMSMTERAYYMTTYENRTVYRMAMTDEMITNQKSVKWFDLPFEPHIVELD
ncbi:choloylglycine hydrolase family protein [Pseudolactococcus paracarnosus]|uniref:Choloylglycine hydrolase family protein n=1 Tax=Pseudolactococcus paracarnosus TaxID=2749962 RepID=A0ABT0AP08_9LACT|nr:choloylglycine hydrolase family protein [Lactococcus paracarnosus]MCJ1978204.1 choloylglycine hydrolase family protein [Lactococcus paracarnosus]MCJ1984347.1 choloylglycine hydrolase family protein [Lactococcus paracarnosus]MCJ1998226.1 choloylglycine hydrolase family protein [Lactococcus paracarnosus]